MATRWKRGSYKGHPLFEIFGERDERKPLISFGLVKAKAILEQVGALRAWVAEHEEPAPADLGQRGDGHEGALARWARIYDETGPMSSAGEPGEEVRA